jgi:hypothetical protein
VPSISQRAKYGFSFDVIISQTRSNLIPSTAYWPEPTPVLARRASLFPFADHCLRAVIHGYFNDGQKIVRAMLKFVSQYFLILLSQAVLCEKRGKAV